MMGSNGLGYCQDCGGTLLPHARSGASRGSCHCPRGPGYINGTLFYGTDRLPEYAVVWMGGEVQLDPPTLDNAVRHLNQLRADYNAAQEGATS